MRAFLGYLPSSSPVANRKWLAALALSVGCFGEYSTAWAQSNSRTQNFEGSSSTGWGYTVSGSGDGGFTDALHVSGNYSFGVTNGTGNGTVSNTLTFDNVGFTDFTSGQTNKLTFRLAVLEAGNKGGLDQNGSVAVDVSTDGGATFTPTIIITGAQIPNGGSGQTFDYVPIITSIARPFPDVDLPRTYLVNNSQKPNSVGIYFATTVLQAKVRITLTANAKTSLLIDDVTISSAGPLPVELISFTARSRNEQVVLSWATASETNNARFVVERSHDGELFEAWREVAGHGTTQNRSNYTITDAQPLSGTGYYRLRQMDFDGTATYSPIVSVGAGAGLQALPTLKLYPNPAADFLTLDLRNIPAERCTVQVLSLTGRVLQTARVMSASSPKLDLSSLPAGTYLVRAYGSNFCLTQRVAKI
ncbi:T9SS type A sorting domain-containing protein [Hymenobacter jejuensis]|uniref:T9SS type A sorting domain-containing protein n=1 Tax=Hymenobacter jejuensis TaxID=2502781 RepID=A0A5B7ZYX5_9BACT|nr:T9SS type A sorting domain-containing protein [Hymenobacter jejuensis]QDA59042.1 T9SS type A sorting domain-containing protein [Hymenobacter jejuensis]